MSNVLHSLSELGLLSHKSDAQLEKILDRPITFYAGFDPTAPSLHIGNLLQIILMMRLQRHGHRPIAVLGGATAMIGDPSGKSEERNLLDHQTIQRNLAGIEKQLRQLLDFDGGPNSALLVNNAEWIGSFSFVDFLRDVGKYFRLGEMLAKESVRQRLQSEAGMSFTEFSYQLLQAYDFLYLSRQYDCILQIGGDDQWGNITAGIELTRKLDGRTIYGLTSPLITTADGRKFGKTEAGTVWLDPDRTCPYEFYQYWVRSDDRDVIRLLKYFTFMPLEQISELQKQLAAQPEHRRAQHVLAHEVTKMVHGAKQTQTVQNASQILFGKEVRGLSDRDLNSIFADVPSTSLPRQRLRDGMPLIDALGEAQMTNSRSEAKKLIKAGGVYINNVRVSDIDHQMTEQSLASETILVLRTGKKNYHLLKFGI